MRTVIDHILHSRGGLSAIICWLSLVPSAAFAQLPDSSGKPVDVHQSKRILFLTFDDGVSVHSHYIDSLATADSIPITVFIIGSRVLKSEDNLGYFDTYRNNPLIEIANHSYSHANGKFKLFYSDPANVVNDIRLNNDLLLMTDERVRLPGRNVWRMRNRKRTDLADAAPAADSLASLGYQVIGWDKEWKCDSGYNGFAGAEEFLWQLAHAEALFSPGKVVILCHEYELANTVFKNELERFILLAKREGYLFKPIGEY